MDASTGNGALAIVTGAAQGIGEATARRLALEHKYSVVILDISEDGEAVASSIVEAGGEARYHHCDVSDYDAVARVGDALGGERVGLVINNAGWTPYELFMEQDRSSWDRIIGVNYVAVLNTTRVFVPLMTEGGSIVNVASDAARIGVPKEAVYAGSKAAVIAFSKAMAVELSRKQITVNVVSPSTTLTPLPLSVLTEEQIERRAKANPLGRLAEPDDVAEAILSFGTGLRYVTGQVLSVNGGSIRVD